MTQFDVTTAEAAPAPGARPYGPFGLLVSVIVILALTLVLTALFIGLLALGDALINGRAHLRDMIDAAGAVIGSGDRTQIIIPALAIGSALYLAAVLAMLLLARWRGGALWRDLLAWRGFSPDPHWLKTTAAIVAYGLIAGFVIVKLYPEAKGWFVMPRTGCGLFFTVLLAVVMAPITEELLFRGWLYTALRARYSFAATLFVTSLFFAVAHFERTGLYALAVFPVGLALGYMRERTGSLFATIAMHAVYNGAAVLAKLLIPDA